MDRDAVKEFLRIVGGPGIELVDHPKWVGLHCLLAPWTHERGTDRTPSAGVSVHDNATSIYNCYTCGKRPLGNLLDMLERYTGEDYGELKEEIGDAEFFGGELPEWGAREVREVELTELDVTQFRDIYEPVTEHWYLTDREVEPDAAEFLGLRYDPEDSHGAERILFPVYTPGGGFLGFTGRATDKTVHPKVRDYHGLPKEACLLGAHLRQPEDTFAVVVEGLFDYAKVTQAGYFCVAVLHSGLTIYQTRILLDLGLPVVLMYDNDAAGRKGEKAAHSALSGLLPVSRVTWYRDTEVAEDWVGMDPGRCTVSEIAMLVDDAEPF